MRSCKMLGAAMLATALMMLGAGGASATTLTSPAGREYSGAIKLELVEEAIFKSSFIGEVKCKESVVEGKVESQGSEVTAGVSLSAFHFSNCSAIFVTLKAGSLELHTDSASADGNGILTSSGAEITSEFAGLHCIFTTSNTSLGTVTGGSSAILAIKSALLPRTGGRSGGFCGSSINLSATYKVVTPSTLLVD